MTQGSGLGRAARRHGADPRRAAHGAARRRRARHRRPRSPPSGRTSPVPEGTREIDASRRHRHARHDRHPPAHVADRDARLRRRLDAHPVLRLVLPRVRQALPPAGRARGQPARRARGARRGRHHVRGLVARPADRRATPRPRSTRCARSPAASCSPTATSSRPRGSGRPRADFQAFARRRIDATTTCSASRWPSTSPATRRSPRRPRTRWRASSACPVTTHAGVWGATNDDGIRLAHEAGFLDESSVFVHAATLSADSYHRIAATGGSVSRLHRERAERGPGLPAHLGAARARHPGVAVDGHQRVVERRPVLRHAHHAGRRPLPRAPRGARRRATRSPTARCAPSRSSTGPPAAAPARWAAPPTSAASRPGKKADVVLLKNDALAGVVPGAQPVRPRRVPGPARRRAHGAGGRARGEVRAPPRRASTWPRPAARSRRTVEHLRATLGEEAWAKGMNPDVPETALVENPYNYTDYGGAMPGR